MNNPKEDQEVEQLLKAAQDDVLLKLSLNSHIARSAGIDPDLDRRYQALKKSEKAVAKQKPKSSAPAASGDCVDADDLFARFAALKKSIPTYSNTESVGNVLTNENTREEESDDEDEVEKVIKWAVDAARLDPSSSEGDDPTDYEDDGDEAHERTGFRGKKKKK